MNTVHMLVGIPGCGKSTFAKKLSSELKIKVVSTDWVRRTHPEMTEPEIWPEVYRVIGEILNNGEDLIYDATNTTKKVRLRFCDNINPYYQNYQIIAYYFNVDWKICYKRVELRNEDPNEHHLPLDIIEGYGSRLMEPSLEEGFVDIFYINEQGDIYQQIKK